MVTNTNRSNNFRCVMHTERTIAYFIQQHLIGGVLLPRQIKTPVMVLGILFKFLAKRANPLEFTSFTSTYLA